MNWKHYFKAFYKLYLEIYKTPPEVGIGDIAEFISISNTIPETHFHNTINFVLSRHRQRRNDFPPKVGNLITDISRNALDVAA